jgi:anaerobic selenocysteine-containing dehydrogenase
VVGRNLRPRRGRHHHRRALVRQSPAALSLYCQGLNQSAHGTHNNAALIHLHLATGQIGRPAPAPSR